jgi:hypothetical protein
MEFQFLVFPCRPKHVHQHLHQNHHVYPVYTLLRACIKDVASTIVLINTINHCAAYPIVCDDGCDGYFGGALLWPGCVF